MFQLSDELREKIFRITLALALLVGISLSLTLWLSIRTFPHIPVLSGLVQIPFPFDVILLIFLMGLLVFIPVSPRRRELSMCVVFVLGVFAFFDQMRWQPWVYLYFFMFLILAFTSQESLSRAKSLNVLRLLVASVYFYSGLSKINSVFPYEIFPWMIDPFVYFFPQTFKELILVAGFVVPYIEIAIGVGLVTRRYRAFAVVGAILMHLFILFSIGVRGWNVIVWPWNMAMIGFVYSLFWKESTARFSDIVWGKKYFLHSITFLFFVIFPAFGLFGFWDSYLSSSLYSGNIKTGHLYVSNEVLKELPGEIRKYATPSGKNTNSLDMYQWSFKELSVPPYPEVRVYKNIADSLCLRAGAGGEVSVVITGGPPFSHGKKVEYTCRSPTTQI